VERRHEDVSLLSRVGSGQVAVRRALQHHGPQHLRAGSGRAWFRRTGALGGCLLHKLQIVVLAIRRYRGRNRRNSGYVWARALLASLSGIAVGTTFLSLGYHPVVWAFMAMPGAYYLAVRDHDPEFHVSLAARSDGYYGDRRVVAGSLARLSSGARGLVGFTPYHVIFCRPVAKRHSPTTAAALSTTKVRARTPIRPARAPSPAMT